MRPLNEEADTLGSWLVHVHTCRLRHRYINPLWPALTFAAGSCSSTFCDLGRSQKSSPALISHVATNGFWSSFSPEPPAHRTHTHTGEGGAVALCGTRVHSHIRNIKNSCVCTRWIQLSSCFLWDNFTKCSYYPDMDSTLVALMTAAVNHIDINQPTSLAFDH